MQNYCFSDVTGTGGGRGVREKCGGRDARLLKTCATNVTDAIAMCTCVYENRSASVRPGFASHRSLYTCFLRRQSPSPRSPLSAEPSPHSPPRGHSGRAGAPSDAQTPPTCTLDRAHFLSCHQFLIYWLREKITTVGRGEGGGWVRGRRNRFSVGTIICDSVTPKGTTRGFMKFSEQRE